MRRSRNLGEDVVRVLRRAIRKEAHGMRTLSALHSGSGRVCRCLAGRSSGACEGVCDLQGGGF